MLNPLLEQECKKRYEEVNKWANIQSQILTQRAKINWINYGYESSRYFHAHVKDRNSHNGIHILYNSAGERLVSKEAIEHEITYFYKSLLGTETQ